MTVRAKFIVGEINQFQTSRENDEGKSELCVGYRIKMGPVYESPPADSKDRGNAALENRIFGRASPSGALEITIVNEQAAEQFKVGRSYYLDFSPAD